MGLVLAFISFTVSVCVSVAVQTTAQFTVQPMSVIQAEGLMAVFECLLYPGVMLYSWSMTINGILQNSTSDIMAVLPAGDTPASLTIPAIPQYNNTVVQCRAIVEVGGGYEAFLSENATLAVLGIGVIDESVNNRISVNWADQNFTTNITYCVDVVQLFGANNTSLHLSSVCGLTVTQYIFPSPGHGPCDRFNLAVTPAEGEMNGTSSAPVIEFFNKAPVPKNVVIECDDKEDSQLCQLSGSDGSSLAGVCRFQLNFTSIDDSVLSMIKDSMMIDGTGSNDYVFHVNIAANRKYSMKADVLVREATTILPAQNLTTHDIVNAEATSVSTSDIVTSCTFSEGTNATGYLAIVTSKNCPSEMADAIFFTDYNTENEPFPLDGVGEGDYNVAFFDLESNGLPSYSSSTNINDVYIGAASVQGVAVPSGARTNTFHGTTDTINGTAMVNDINGNQICIRCSSECLALVYSCDNIDVTVSVMVSGGKLECIGPLPDGAYSAALFSLINQSAMLHRHPGKQVSLIINASTLSAASSTISSTVPDVHYTSIETTYTPLPVNVIAVLGSGAAIATFILGVIVVTVAFICWKKHASKTYQKSVVTVSRKLHTEYKQDAEGGIMSGGNDVIVEDTPLKAISHPLSPEKYLHPEVIDDEFVTPDSTYAVVESKRVMVKKPANERLPVDTAVTKSVYAEIAGSLHQEQTYAHVTVKPQSKGLPEDQVDALMVEYATLDNAKLVGKSDDVEDEAPKEEPPEVPRRPTPPNAQNLHALLTPAAGKWFAIGVAMGFSQHDLGGDIFSGNSTDWLRLGEILDLFTRSKPTWEEIVHILWEVEEWELADKVCRQEGLEVQQPEVQSRRLPAPPLPPKPTMQETGGVHLY